MLVILMAQLRIDGPPAASMTNLLDDYDESGDCALLGTRADVEENFYTETQVMSHEAQDVGMRKHSTLAFFVEFVSFFVPSYIFLHTTFSVADIVCALLNIQFSNNFIALHVLKRFVRSFQLFGTQKCYNGEDTLADQK